MERIEGWIQEIALQHQAFSEENWPPYMECNERPKKEADSSRFVDKSFNKKVNIYTRLVLGSDKTSRSLLPSTRILKVYIEA